MADDHDGIRHPHSALVFDGGFLPSTKQGRQVISARREYSGSISENETERPGRVTVCVCVYVCTITFNILLVNKAYKRGRVLRSSRKKRGARSVPKEKGVNSFCFAHCLFRTVTQRKRKTERVSNPTERGTGESGGAA